MLSRKTFKFQNWSVWLSDKAIVAVLLVCIITTLPSLVRAASIPDSDITYWVKEALRQDARVDASEITVSTKEGIVTLSGSVNNIAAKKYADLEAKKIDGVLGVINEIVVSPTWRSDTDIRNAVRRRILNSAVIESEGISVMCLDDKVTLSGKVKSYAEKKEAELLASEVRGVKEVTNNIMTEWETQRSDQEIKNDAVAALERDVYLNALPITVSVKDRVITLEGTVGSAYEKDRAENDIQWISNVKSIDNKLKVEWWEKRGVREKRSLPSDADLKKTVKDALDQDIRIDASDISVNVSYGQVILNGSVYSHYEKRIAEQDARDVVGVGWVTNNLFARVDKREDWAVRDDVKFNLDTDAITEGFDIGVKVKDGVVTLTGNVHNWYERYHAEEVASRVKGVKNVINQITVYRPTTRIHPDAAVANDIKERFKQNWAVSNVSGQINVSVKNGVAILTGEVDTWAQYRQAAEVAFNTEGLWKVDNRLTVKGYNYNWENWYLGEPYIYDPDEPHYPWYTW
jgi:osmotically-inducible protein OsmY